MAIYQEKNKNKLPKNGYSWYYRTYYTDMYGNRKQKQSKMYPSKTLAKDAERDFLDKISTTDIINKNIMFEIVYNEYFEDKKTILKPTTYYGLKKSLDKNILKYFKEYKLHSIKINSINDWINNLNKDKNTIRYQNSVIGHFIEILEFANYNYDFDKKIISKIHKHRNDTITETKKEAEWNFWTYEEFQKFISSIDNNFYYLVFSFLYYTGLRIGEMIALTWTDVDLNNKTLKIYKNFTNKIGNNSYAILEPKTSNSVREIDLDNNLVSLLEKHYKREKNIYNFNEEMFLFGNAKHISQGTLTRHLKHYIEKAEVKRITLHGFRHSHVSLLIDLGCDSRDVAARVGDTIQTVERTYYHMFPKKKAATVIALNKLTSKN